MVHIKEITYADNRTRWSVTNDYGFYENCADQAQLENAKLKAAMHEDAVLDNEEAWLRADLNSMRDLIFELWDRAYELANACCNDYVEEVWGERDERIALERVLSKIFTRVTGQELPE